MKYFTLFLILCVLANAADECKTGGDTHCEECVNEEKKCGVETHYCACCEEGYEPDGALKCKKIACLVEGCQKCVSDNNQKCDTCVANAYEKDGDKCKKTCSIDHCLYCKSKDECQTCEVGYKLSSDNKKCDEVDCSNNEATHCDKCSDTKDKAQCQLCESGYYKDSFDSDGKCKDLDVCKIVEEGCHEKTETIIAYDPEKCYKYSGQYMKIENEKKCYYSDSGCKTKAKVPKIERNRIDSCEKIGDHWYKYKEDKDECKVKQYDKDGCSDGKDIDAAGVCEKSSDSEYIRIYGTTKDVTVYSDKDCTKAVEVESECVDMGCTGSSGAAINMIILTILIISFMI